MGMDHIVRHRHANIHMAQVGLFHTKHDRSRHDIDRRFGGIMNRRDRLPLTHEQRHWEETTSRRSRCARERQPSSTLQPSAGNLAINDRCLRQLGLGLIMLWAMLIIPELAKMFESFKARTLERCPCWTPHGVLTSAILRILRDCPYQFI